MARTIRGSGATPDHPFTRWPPVPVKVSNLRGAGSYERQARALSAQAEVDPRRAPNRFQRICVAMKTIETIAPSGGSQSSRQMAHRRDPCHCNISRAAPVASDQRVESLGDPVLTGQARRHRVGTDLLRLGLVHGLHDDDRSHARGRSRKLRALEIHSPVGVQQTARHQLAPLARSSSRPRRPAPSWW